MLYDISYLDEGLIKSGLLQDSMIIMIIIIIIIITIVMIFGRGANKSGLLRDSIREKNYLFILYLYSLKKYSVILF